MKFFFLFLLALIPTILFGQETKKIRDTETGETYYVLKSDKTIKHGEYKKFAYNHSLLVKGFYKQGLKDSIWECYNFNGEVTLKFDYSKNELIFYKPGDTYLTYKIINNSDNPDTTLSRPPIFLEGEAAFTSNIFKHLRYPANALLNGIAGKVNVSFIVDKRGKTSNYKVERPLGYGLDMEAIRVLKLQPDNWLPGIQNGQAVDTEVIKSVTFKIN